MKKVLAIAISLVMLFALSLTVSAQVNIDCMYVDIDTLQADENGVNVGYAAAGSVTINPGQKINILGWAYGSANQSNLKEIVTVINGVEYKCDDNYMDRPGLASNFGVSDSIDTHAGIGQNGDMLGLGGVSELSEGTYTVRINAKFEDGTVELGKKFTLIVGSGVDPNAVPVTEVPVYASGDGNGAHQFNEGPIGVVCTVPEGKALHAVVGLNSPTWGANAGGSDAKAEVYAWKGDYDSSVAGGVLASGTVKDHYDNDNAVFTLDKDLPAGEYLVVFSVTGTGYIGVWSFDSVSGTPAAAFQNGAEVNWYPKVAADLVEAPAAPESIIDESKYDVSYKINKDNAKNWAGGQIGDIDVTYFFKVEDDGLAVAVRGINLLDGNYVQLNFNPNNQLGGVQGQFISFVMGDTIKVLQHNHKNGLDEDPNAGGKDITDKIDATIQNIGNGYEFTAKLPKALFDILDVEGFDYTYGEDDLYFGMFLVAGGGGLTNQSQGPGNDWTCDGLGLTEYVFRGTPAPVTEPETQPTTAPVTEPETEPNTQTGDVAVAMLAVVAILAMSAAVIFMKKKVF